MRKKVQMKVCLDTTPTPPPPPTLFSQVAGDKGRKAVERENSA